MREPQRFQFVSSDRRVREDRRFVAGQGRFAADIALPEMKHVALVTSPHPAARIVAIDKAAALAMPGAHDVLDGSELAAGSLPFMAGLDAPNVPRRPLAVDVALFRRMGRRGGGGHARACRGRGRARTHRLSAATLCPRCRSGTGRTCAAGSRRARLERAPRPHLRMGRRGA